MTTHAGKRMFFVPKNGIFRPCLSKTWAFFWEGGLQHPFTGCHTLQYMFV